MEQFAQDVQVQTKFVEVAISRSVMPERIGEYKNINFSLLFYYDTQHCMHSAKRRTTGPTNQAGIC